MASSRPDRPLPDGRIATWRHPLWVRATHWIVALAAIILLMSGLNILEAHPHLYWGLRSTFSDPWLSFRGGFPDWMTLPSLRDLALARRWHFFFAWVFVIAGLVYLVCLVATGRLERRLAPTKPDLAGFWTSVKEHALLRFPESNEAYNVVQKLAYLAMIFLILPLMLLTGLSMSPGFNATGAGNVLLDILGGRQSARSLHFLSAMLILAFIVVHVGLVVRTGLWNNLRAMITGWYVIGEKRE